MDGAALVRRWFEEVWNQGREQTIDELLAAEAPMHGLSATGEVPRGPAEFKPFWKQLRAACPDIRITVEEAISQGNTTAIRWTAEMTHSGDHLGVPATGKKVIVSGMGFAHIENGKIVEGWNNWDELGMTSAIGMTPSTAKASRLA